jgi:hypothetical protein
MAEKLFRIEVDYRALCKDTFYITAATKEIAMAAVAARPDSWTPHRSKEIVEVLDEAEEISEDGSVEIRELPPGTQAYAVQGESS